MLCDPTRVRCLEQVSSHREQNTGYQGQEVRGEELSPNGCGVSVRGDEKVLEMSNGDGMYLRSLSCVL